VSAWSDPSFLIIQSIGVVGFGLFALSFQWLRPRHTILQQSLANMILCGHFWALGHEIATFIAFAASLRDIGSALGSKQVQISALCVFLVLLYTAAFFLVEGWVDCCAVAGSTVATIAQFFRRKFYVYRFCMVGHQILWLIVYWVIFSIPGLVFLSSILLSNIIGVVRHFMKNKTF